MDERAVPDRPWREVREYMALTDATIAHEKRDAAKRAAQIRRGAVSG